MKNWLWFINKHSYKAWLRNWIVGLSVTPFAYLLFRWHSSMVAHVVFIILAFTIIGIYRVNIEKGLDSLGL